MTEQLIYEEGRIRITSHVFSNGRGEQFVIATLRGIRDVHKGKSFWPLIIGLILLGLAGWREFFPDSQIYMGGAGALFVLWFLTQKERYKIMLSTPAGEVEAFSTKKEEQHKNVMSCLKKAMAMHKGI